MKNNVEFLKAASPQQKLSQVTSTVEKLFLEGKRIQILGPSDEALKFIDELLWTYKPESFLPHMVAGTPSKEVVVLSKSSANLNNADVLINLLPSLPPTDFFKAFSMVYELLDETTPEKKAQADLKVAAWTT